MRFTPVLLLGLALTLLSACEQLGNPSLRHGRTAPVAWRAEGIDIVTSSQTFPSELASDALRALPSHQLQQVEPFPSAGGTVTLVAVDIKTARGALPYTVRLLTLITLPNGRVIRRAWQSTGRGPTFYAAWAIEQSPTHVVTRLR